MISPCPFSIASLSYPLTTDNQIIILLLHRPLHVLLANNQERLIAPPRKKFRRKLDLILQQTKTFTISKKSGSLENPV